MNYLKSIAQIRKAESDLQIARLEACNIIGEVAGKMYDAELEPSRYRTWSAIYELIESLRHMRD